MLIFVKFFAILLLLFSYPIYRLSTVIGKLLRNMPPRGRRAPNRFDEGRLTVYRGDAAMAIAAVEEEMLAREIQTNFWTSVKLSNGHLVLVYGDHPRVIQHHKKKHAAVDGGHNNSDSQRREGSHSMGGPAPAEEEERVSPGVEEQGTMSPGVEEQGTMSPGVEEEQQATMSPGVEEERVEGLHHREEDQAASDRGGGQEDAGGHEDGGRRV